MQDAVSLDLQDPRVSLENSFRQYYLNGETSPCMNGEFRWSRSWAQQFQLLQLCSDDTETGYCNGNGKCFLESYKKG